MKTLFTFVAFVAACAASSLSAADFSGTITWTMRAEITDPEMKKQMEAGERMSGPEMQEQMKAAQEAMNSPQMQEMLKANPQMREMMEKQMKALSKPGAGGNFFPKSTTVHVKGARSLVKTEGGVAVGDMLTWADKGVTYLIDREARTYQKLPEAEKETEEGKFKVTPTKETTKVLGYTCRNYLVETTEGDVKMTWSIWTTDDIKGFNANSLRRLRFGQSSGSGFMGKIDGVPLKIDATTPQMKLFMVATNVKSETLPDSLFELPAGFKEVAVR